MDDGNSNGAEIFNDEPSHIEHTQEEDDDPEREKQRMLEMINKIVEKQEYYEVA